MAYTDSVNNTLAAWIGTVYLKIADMFSIAQITGMISGNRTAIEAEIAGNMTNLNATNLIIGSVPTARVTNVTCAAGTVMMNYTSSGAQCIAAGGGWVGTATSNLTMGNYNTTMNNNTYTYYGSESQAYIRWDSANKQLVIKVS